jgi:short-subunit dehydrogenase
MYHTLDLTSDVSIETVIDAILNRHGRIDVLINNAGQTIVGPTLKFSPNQFKDLLDINVVGTFRMIRSCLAKGANTQFIFNITSLNGILSLPNYALYSSSKFAQEALGIALSQELRHHEISVVNLTVGALESESNMKTTTRSLRDRIPLLDFIFPLTRPSTVGDTIAKLLRRTNPPSRVLIGRDTLIINTLQRILPMSFFEKIIGYLLK